MIGPDIFSFEALWRQYRRCGSQTPRCQPAAKLPRLFFYLVQYGFEILLQLRLSEHGDHGGQRGVYSREDACSLPALTALLTGSHPLPPSVRDGGLASPDGAVGAISGIQQKIAAARDADAVLFLAPSANCGAAIGADAGDMLVVPVDTLDEAVDVLEDVRAGDVEGLPSCADDAG